jgi:hypothetical protein
MGIEKRHNPLILWKKEIPYQMEIVAYSDDLARTPRHVKIAMPSDPFKNDSLVLTTNKRSSIISTFRPTQLKVIGDLNQRLSRTNW